MSYEKPTDELRGVIRDGISPDAMFRIQRKWLVQDGESYRSPEQRPGLVVRTAGWHPLEPNLGFQWTPVREEWRDLPCVTEAEAAVEISKA